MKRLSFIFPGLSGILAAISILCGLGVSHAVEITPNSVYRLKNHKGQYLTFSNSSAVTAAGDVADEKQQWYFTPNDDGTEGFYMRNASSAAYLRSSLGRSSGWTVSLTPTPDEGSMLMLFSDIDGEVVFRASNLSNDANFMYAHSDSGNNVVCWSTNSDNTKWTLEKVDMSDAQLTALHQKFLKIDNALTNKSTVQTHLSNLFDDNACTKLKSGVQTNGNPHYDELPDILKAMVNKIAGGDWSEKYDYSTAYPQAGGDWNSAYARKYRVQWYEPFSEGGAAAGMAGIQSHTNMNNPTGILGDKGNIIYVMVEGDIKPGSTLYIQEVVGGEMNNTATAGTQLSSGLNVVPVVNDNAHLFIYYTVATTKTVNGSRVPDPDHILGNYKPLKIHIEGGRINGFFNAEGDRGVDASDEFYYTPDKKDDLLYTVARATHPMYDLIGRLQILHLHLDDTQTPTTTDFSTSLGVRSVYTGAPKTGHEYDPVKTMAAWDYICLIERTMMGLQSPEDIADPLNKGYYEDIVNKGYELKCGGTTYKADPGFYFSDYFNNRHFALSAVNSPTQLSMNATHWRTLLNTNRINGILTRLPLGNSASGAGDGEIWDPAHEYGHLNQQLIKIAGTTETSNNLFTNACVRLLTEQLGQMQLSRTNYASDILKVYLNKRNYLENGYGVTRLLYQLWLYYHVQGYNRQFYPRLFELLRHNPIRYNAGTGGRHDEKYDQLHIYKMACIAAGEDLTEFFEAYGFFVPLNDYLIRDYSTYIAVLSQEEIDKAKKEIADLKLRKNFAITLIDDKVNPPAGSINNIVGSANAGQYGGLDDFNINAPATPKGNMSFTIDGVTVQVIKDEGATPGVGYVVRDSEGNLCGFANSDNFVLNPDLIGLLIEGKASIFAIGADNSTLPVTNVLQSGSVNDKLDMLKKTYAYFKTVVTPYIDETETRVGFMQKSFIDGLIDGFGEQVDELVGAASPDEVKITTLITDILATQLDVLDNTEYQIQIEPGAAYKIRCYSNQNILAVTNQGNDAGKTLSHYSDNGQVDKYWILSSTDKSAELTIQNWDSRVYINKTGVNLNNSIPVSKEVKEGFSLRPVEGMVGVYNICLNDSSQVCIAANTGAARQDIYLSTTGGGVQTQWYIYKIKNADYVEQRDKLGELIDKFRDMMQDWNGPFWYLPDAWEIYVGLEQEILDGYKNLSTPIEEIDKYVDLLESNAVYADALINGATIYNLKELNPSNDCTDDNFDDNVIRQAFKSVKKLNVNDEEIYQNRFDNLITLSDAMDADNIEVVMTGVNYREWLKANYEDGELTGDEEIDALIEAEKYRNIFERYGIDEHSNYWFGVIDINRVDGFYSQPEAHLEENPAKPGTYHLIANVSCSGLYQVKLKSRVPTEAIFDSDNKIPTFNVEIYPNIVTDFESVKALNIDGFEFSDDSEHRKTILIPEDYITGSDLTQCIVYFPGLYFAKELTGKWGEDSEVSLRLASYAKVKRYASSSASQFVSTPFSTTINLESLKNDVDEGVVLVNAVKNGATANYAIRVAIGSNDIITGIDEITDEAEDGAQPIYYNLNGIRVKNPGHGIYIRVSPKGRAEKVKL